MEAMIRKELRIINQETKIVNKPTAFAWDARVWLLPGTLLCLNFKRC